MGEIVVNIREIQHGLLISDDGRAFKEVRYFDRGTTKIRYVAFSFKAKKYDMHRMVATAFLENPENKPCVLHSDDNPQNNHISNLRWGTYKENMADAKARGRFNRANWRPREAEERDIEIAAMINIGIRQRAIAERLGITESRICQIKKRLEKEGFLKNSSKK